MKAVVQRGYGPPERSAARRGRATADRRRRRSHPGSRDLGQHPRLDHGDRNPLRAPPEIRVAWAAHSRARNRRGRGGRVRRQERDRSSARRRGVRVCVGREPRDHRDLRRAYGRAGFSASREAGRAFIRGSRGSAHVRHHGAPRDAGRREGRPGRACADQRRVGRRRDVRGANGQGTRNRGHRRLQHEERRIGRIPGSRSCRRLHARGLHPRRPPLRRDPRQRAQPSGQGDRARPGAGRNLHPEQRREHGRLVRRAAEDGERGPDGQGLDQREIRQLRREPGKSECPGDAPRVRRRQNGHRHGLLARRDRRRVAHMLGHHARGKVVIAL
jgi:hypothetical protein